VATRNVPLLVSHYNISNKVLSTQPDIDRRLLTLLSPYLWRHATLVVDKADIVHDSLSSLNSSQSTSAYDGVHIALEVRHTRSFRIASNMRLRIKARLLIPRFQIVDNGRVDRADEHDKRPTADTFLSTVYAVDRIEYVREVGQKPNHLQVCIADEHVSNAHPGSTCTRLCSL
jgi:hypothetical protein